MSPRKKRERGQGTRPRTAMVLCIVLFLLAVTGLWYLGRDDAAPAPPVAAAPQGPRPEEAKLADQQSALVREEDDRIVSKVFRRPTPARRGPDTTVLPARPAPYTLASLIAFGAARPAGATPDGAPVVDVVRSVVVLPGARLTIDAPGTTVRLASGSAGFVSLVGWEGGVSIAGTAKAPLTLTSWDGAAKGPDTVPTDGRAYVRVIGGELNAAFVKASDLGFWSGRTGGLAITGNAGKPAAATVNAVEVRNSFYGLYTSDASKVAVTDSTFAGNTTGGVLLHRGSTNVVVERTVAIANGGAGFAAGRGSQAVVLRQVSAEGNAGDGINVDGRPLADQPGPAGESTVGHRDFRIEGSTVSTNRDDGIQAVDTDDLVVVSNQIDGNRNGIVLSGPITGAQVTDNQVNGAGLAAIAVRTGPAGVVLGGNRVRGGNPAIQIRDAQVEARGNTVVGATDHALSVAGAVPGSSVIGNALGGRGRSALDLARLNPGVGVVVNANNEDGWVVDIPVGERLLDLVRVHPLLPLWALVLLLPVLVLVVRRKLKRWRAKPYGGAIDRSHGQTGETRLVPLDERRAAAQALRRPAPTPVEPAGPRTPRPSAPRPSGDWPLRPPNRPWPAPAARRPAPGNPNRPLPPRPNRSTGVDLR